MAKRTALQLTNVILARINQSQVSDISTLTAGSHSNIILEYLNDAQNVLAGEAIWADLVVSRTFSTVASQQAYAVQSDFAQGFALINSTNDIILTETHTKLMLFDDPDQSVEGTPEFFSYQEGNYLLYPIPDSVDSMIDWYVKEPSSFSVNGDLSDLPLSVEPCILKWAESEIFDYLNNSTKSILALNKYKSLRNLAVDKNEEVIDRIRVIDSTQGQISARSRFQKPIM